MMEISNDIKAKIFSQYLGCNVEYDFEGWPFKGTKKVEELTTENLTLMCFSLHRKLLLKPLSAISDAEAIEVAKIFHPGNDACQVLRKKEQGDLFIIDIDSSHSLEYSLQVEFNFSGQGNIHSHRYSSYIKESNVTEAYQYLQSRGYALGYLNYTVEDLINANVYKIIE